MERLLLIVDMLTPWDFDGAERMVGEAGRVVPRIAAIRESVRGSAEIAYANDLEAGFHGSRERAVELALAGRHPELVKPLLPAPDEDFIHKGQHSAFYGTPLAHLLKLREVEELVLVGQVTEQCILYTALDAHVRGYAITVPVDGVIAQDAELGRAALRMIERNMGGRLVEAVDLLR